MLAGKESDLDYRKPVFKAMDYISHHLDDNPGLDEVAAAAAISTFHFHRIFKTIVGETIAGFTRRLRMERAARRLLASPKATSPPSHWPPGSPARRISPRPFACTSP
ncbi:hypothetical protein [Aeromonas veronii]|uniref:hypothetical protein n=1 Tax=Aeromonas veronii TaxID=654 RepID=UPI003D1FC405